MADEKKITIVEPLIHRIETPEFTKSERPIGGPHVSDGPIQIGGGPIIPSPAPENPTPSTPSNGNEESA
ncbi:hypothetical protein [Methylosinus sp. R-45379]|uniref:hypothetical protein n=1 Tax=Methylosinus sp. R-45379 TaxID=980563 RepID=UPI0012EE8358|nr:hypothetical protein [Methylosinus sp. R-45379]